MVATPIGNLADISLRSLHVLQMVDAIACEDTRHTQGMLRSYGLERPGHQLLAVHQHNEAEAAAGIIALLQQGQRIAYVSDAGTPGVSDPGARLCAALAAAGLRAMPLPGASSITALLSVAGTGGHDGGFVFTGFLSPKTTERQREVQAIAADPRACVLLEAPHRIEALARDLAALGERPVTVGRELTKQFEEVAQLPAAELPAWLQAGAHRTRGEFVLLVHPSRADTTDDAIDATTLRTLDLLLAELPVKTAVKLCAEISGAPRNRLYEAGLKLRRSGDE